jgi:hypothetical protein
MAVVSSGEQDDGDFYTGPDDLSTAKSWQRRRGVLPSIPGCTWRSYSRPSASFANLSTRTLRVDDSAVLSALVYAPTPPSRCWRVSVNESHRRRWALKDGAQPEPALNAVNALVIDLVRTPQSEDNSDTVDDTCWLTLESLVMETNDSAEFVPQGSITLQEASPREPSGALFRCRPRVIVRPITNPTTGVATRASVMTMFCSIRLTQIAKDQKIKILVQIVPVATNVFVPPLTAMELVQRVYSNNEQL